MNLKYSNIEEPNVVSALRFSEHEAAEALREYATKHGYEFNGVKQILGVSFFNQIGDENFYQLVVRAEGTSEPLIKEGDDATEKKQT